MLTPKTDHMPTVKLHRRQFVVGPRPFRASDDWLCHQLSPSTWMSYCPELRAGWTTDADGTTWSLLGLAVQTLEGEADPLDGISAAPTEAVPGLYASWAGRWVLIGRGQVHMDASGLLGCFYGRGPDDHTWVSSSPALLSRILSPDAPLATHPRKLRYGVGLSWFTPPQSRFLLGPIRLHRAGIYFYANVLVAAAAGLYFWQHGYQRSFHRWQGLALVLGSMIFMWPIVQQIFQGRRRLKWCGVSMWNRNVPRWCATLPAFVIFFAMNPYLGLRTAGTFTMFSNLRTEGDSSNHLLLGSNPLKLLNYQEDLVEIIAIDPRHAKSHKQALAGHLLPVVEFKKRIEGWRRKGIDNLYAVVKYQNRVYETDDLVLDNLWGIRGRDLEMYLLDFRVVQKSPTPNHCRW